MAKLLIIAPSQYYQGQVTLFRGDEWNINAQITEDYNGVRIPVDLTGATVSGFFPAASGGDNLAFAASLVNESVGLIRVNVPESASSGTELMQDPISWYIEMDQDGARTTVQTPDTPLVITDPQFNS